MLFRMFRMMAAGMFSTCGGGIVVTGSVQEGALRVGSEVRINDQSARVDGIEASGPAVMRRVPGTTSECS